MTKNKKEWKVVIKDYLTHVELSRARRAKFYTKEDLALEKIPKKYIKQGIEFNKKGRAILISTKEEIIKNTRTKGTPKYWKISGQDLWSGNMHHSTRSKMNEQLHKHFCKFIIEQIQNKGTKIINLTEEERLFICFKFRDKVEQSQDIDNLSIIYVKTFIDSLTQKSNKNQNNIEKTGLIPDDNVKYIKGVSYEFEESSERVMEVTIKIVSK